MRTFRVPLMGSSLASGEFVGITDFKPHGSICRINQPPDSIDGFLYLQGGYFERDARLFHPIAVD